MAEKNKNDNADYFIDVARDHIYQNQGKEYTKAFTEWRNDEKNPYGYAFIHDRASIHTLMVRVMQTNLP